MSSKAQLEAIVAGYREELAVQRLQYQLREDEWLEETATYISQAIGLSSEIDRLNDEADRQEDRLIDLERQLEARQGQGRDMMTVSKAPEPKITFQSQMAILAVALMLENRAASMAIRVGADASEYSRLCEEAHWLRAEVDTVDPNVEAGAEAMYEGLTTAF